jgi:membrane protein implicated in regulation of membrane protease activity
VRILQDFRDRYLMPSRLGQRMVDFYYRHSPKIASLIAKHKAVKLAVRFSLLPFIAFSYSMLRFGPAMTAALLLVISAILVVCIWKYWRRVKRNRRSKFIQKGKRA